MVGIAGCSYGKRKRKEKLGSEAEPKTAPEQAVLWNPRPA
jgi:hypothetical protein